MCQKMKSIGIMVVEVAEVEIFPSTWKNASDERGNCEPIEPKYIDRI